MNSKTTPGKPYPPTERLVNATAPATSALNLEIRRNIYESSGKDVTPAEQYEKDANGEDFGANGEARTKPLEESLKEPEKEFFCHSCGKNCTRVRWHNAKSTPGSMQGKIAAMARYDICAECFLEGRFAASTTASDYTKIEYEGYTSIKDRDKPWNDGETLLLLEGLELFDEDWSSIANHVGTRTREQCVLKFLQLEIEDKYLDAETGTDNGANLAYLTGGRAPFSQAENPVMSVVGFLASAVDPSVAAAAAGRSVEEMRRTLRESLENGEDEKPSSNDPAAKKETSQAEQTDPKPDDAMDLDPAATTAKASPSSSVPELTTITTKTKPSDPATTALALAAARSSALASHEERHMTALLSTATNLQLQKLELKLQQFGEMEKLLQKERRDLERRRRDLFLERLRWTRRVDATKEAVGRGLRMSTAGTISGEVLKAVMDALAGMGIGAVLELKERLASGGGAGEGKGEDGGVAEEGPNAKVDIEPYGPEDQGFRSYEI